MENAPEEQFQLHCPLLFPKGKLPPEACISEDTDKETLPYTF